jgi:Tfp pilus assembly protein PilV
MNNRKSGATLLEVLFATVVIVVGLIGIATLIPFAARDAQDAINHNQAVALGSSWSDAFLVREFHKPDGVNNEFRWIWMRDYQTSDGTTTFNPQWELFRRGGYQGAAPFEQSIRARVNNDPSGTSSPYEASTFSGGGAQSRRIWGHMPVCIDPNFFADNVRVAADISGGTVTESKPGWYRASVFPYFKDQYDPAVDPYGTGSTLQTDQPRMLRIGLVPARQVVAPTVSNPNPPMIPAPENLISSFFSSADDYVDSTFVDLDSATDPRATRQDQKSLPPERLFALNSAQRTVGAGWNVPANQALRSLYGKRFTWMATITPEEPSLSLLGTPAAANSYIQTPAATGKLTLLVMHQHSSGYVPADGTYSAGSDPQDKPKGERAVRVYPLSGNFVGGAGGRVRLIGSATTSNKVEAGDWIMLSRYFAQDAAPTPRFYPYFRWYRIIGVDVDAMEGTLSSLAPAVGTNQYASANAANGNSIVWARDVSLEGLDFRFAETTAVPPVNQQVPYAWYPSIPTPTTGTLVSGVVTVFHNQINLN